MTIRAFIDDLGGVGWLSATLGAPYTTVRSWNDRHSIPLTYWPRLLEIAHAKGLDYSNDSLVAMHNATEPIEG